MSELPSYGAFLNSVKEHFELKASEMRALLDFDLNDFFCHEGKSKLCYDNCTTNQNKISWLVF